MCKAYFHFHDELNDFLPKIRRDVLFLVSFNGHETVKHMIESFGVPHTEVNIILINGISVSFDQKLIGGDHVNVYPTDDNIRHPGSISLKPNPMKEFRFVVDGHLGKLAAYLRLLGFDTLYKNDYLDDELADISATDQRLLLTRDRGLLKRTKVTRGYCVREKEPRLQLGEIIDRLHLEKSTQLFSRCVRCNGILNPVSKDEVIDRLEIKTKRYYHEFGMCEDCNQVYWKGSHYKQLLGFFSEFILVEENEKSPVK